MPAGIAGIHVLKLREQKKRMAGTSPAITRFLISKAR